MDLPWGTREGMRGSLESGVRTESRRHTPTICSESDNYCVTISAAAGVGKVVDFGHSLNKGCSPICPGPSVNLGVASVGTHCCQSFLCNFSAADGGLRASATLLGLGLLLSLLPALLRLGP
ncbi:lymphocyte antigen 6E-like [Carlito syrichta]|uniref:Lymphocyte antigen 6E-like n=1 Tax=Carlito syrichta TaxID=1868482 RepID=A0A1U7TA56_CARSF|nr:lymphocyte antigen 6E-like [Carlito syrichta]